MGRLFKAELKKLRSLHIWWLVAAGGVLPGIIACLTLYRQEKAEWLGFTNMSLLSFNVQSLLTFSAFAAYMWAREYEENTMELILCYPYPRFWLLLVKLMLLFLVIVVTAAFYFCTALTAGSVMFGSFMPQMLLPKLIKALLHTGVMHFLLMPVYLYIAMATKASVSGLIFGIVNMCICMALSQTNYIQYIPQGMPYVMGDKLLGVNSLVMDNDMWFYYSILIGTFLIFMAAAKVLADRLKQ
jgi:bacitracin transport system permease protein